MTFVYGPGATFVVPGLFVSEQDLFVNRCLRGVVVCQSLSITFYVVILGLCSPVLESRSAMSRRAQVSLWRPYRR